MFKNVLLTVICCFIGNSQLWASELSDWFASDDYLLAIAERHPDCEIEILTFVNTRKTLDSDKLLPESYRTLQSIKGKLEKELVARLSKISLTFELDDCFNPSAEHGLFLQTVKARAQILRKNYENVEDFSTYIILSIQLRQLLSKMGFSLELIESANDFKIQIEKANIDKNSKILALLKAMRKNYHKLTKIEEKPQNWSVDNFFKLPNKI